MALSARYYQVSSCSEHRVLVDEKLNISQQCALRPQSPVLDCTNSSMTCRAMEGSSSSAPLLGDPKPEPAFSSGEHPPAPQTQPLQLLLPSLPSPSIFPPCCLPHKHLRTVLSFLSPSSVGNKMPGCFLPPRLAPAPQEGITGYCNHQQPL